MYGFTLVYGLYWSMQNEFHIQVIFHRSMDVAEASCKLTGISYLVSPRQKLHFVKDKHPWHSLFWRTASAFVLNVSQGYGDCGFDFSHFWTPPAACFVEWPVFIVPVKYETLKLSFPLYSVFHVSEKHWTMFSFSFCLYCLCAIHI